MLDARIDAVYTAEVVKTGTSKLGDYEMILLKAGGNDLARIPIWVKNVPSNVTQGSKFIIKEILGARIRHIKPSDRFDKWQDEFSIDAIVQPV